MCHVYIKTCFSPAGTYARNAGKLGGHMLLIPQIYLKNGRAVGIGRTTSPLFRDDPIATAKAMKEAGAEVIQCIDLEIPPVGVSSHLPIIKKIHDEVKLAVYADGGFKTVHAVESFVAAGVEIVCLGSIAYQQPHFLEEASQKFPGKIAAHIDVRSGHVTIPGYAVVANKTPFDYADRFLEAGIRHIFYSEVGGDGLIADEHFDKILTFCKRVTARIVCTSEIRGPADIERIIKMNIPRLDGLVLAKILSEGRIDLRGAIAMASDLEIEHGDESTLTEM